MFYLYLQVSLISLAADSIGLNEIGAFKALRTLRACGVTLGGDEGGGQCIDWCHPFYRQRAAGLPGLLAYLCHHGCAALQWQVGVRAEYGSIVISK